MDKKSSKICRGCLNKEENFTYVLGDNVSTELYLFCTTVEVYHDDSPRTLCDTCYENLTKYSEFKRTCIQSQNTLYHNLNRENGAVTSEIYTGDDSKYLQGLNPITVKAEDYHDDIHDILKTEDATDNFSNDLYDVFNLDENLYSTSSKKIKKRKVKLKIDKQTKALKKAKLKITHKHFSFTCELCNKKFNYLERFEAHKLEHEGKEVLISCSPCNKTFVTWSGLRRHNDSEHTLVRLDRLKCNICGKICKNQQTLKMHYKTHGERKQYVCDVCGKGFTTKFILKAHLETHKENRERLFTCEHCGKKFYTNTILLSHVSRRHTNRRFICQICSYPFTDKYNLAKHLLIHDGKKLFKCEICNKSYATQSSLVEHRRIHSGERPYICSYCPKSFLSKRRLDDHHKIHTGERPHKCMVCEQGFTQRGTLKRHMKVHDRTMPMIN
ncbi:unnamed protein product [Chilo suppressalis]|uniref:Uncharacterized protein n=1 Tax=Chilo suppressalis TaxID=168631 RepID=A0ABN8BBP2_CHISP|nr:unnamed protein product [Chilo suppressalis]